MMLLSLLACGEKDTETTDTGIVDTETNDANETDG